MLRIVNFFFKVLVVVLRSLVLTNVSNFVIGLGFEATFLISN
jgi:hypothetical protein